MFNFFKRTKPEPVLQTEPEVKPDYEMVMDNGESLADANFIIRNRSGKSALITINFIDED